MTERSSSPEIEAFIDALLTAYIAAEAGVKRRRPATEADDGPKWFASTAGGQPLPQRVRGVWVAIMGAPVRR